MRLVLHVGMGKTGTSTLQRALDTNPSVLAEAGILYPDTGTRAENHNALMTPFLPLTDNVPREFRQQGREHAAEARRGETLWATIRRQVKAARPDTVVLSGEYLFTQPVSLLAPLRDQLAEFFDDIHVVAYVRPPASHYLSLVQQQVKASYAITPPAKYQSPLRSCLSRHLHVFGDRVSVRPFDRTHLVGGDVVADFLTHFVPGGDRIAGAMTVQDLNESMSAEAMCVMQELRRRAWPDRNDAFFPESTLVLAVLTWGRDRLPPQATAWLRPGISAGIANRHADDLRWLVERFSVDFTEGLTPRAARCDAVGWESQQLTEVLEVVPEDVEAVLYGVVKELAAHVPVHTELLPPGKEPRRTLPDRIKAPARSIRRLARRVHA